MDTREGELFNSSPSSTPVPISLAGDYDTTILFVGLPGMAGTFLLSEDASYWACPPRGSFSGHRGDAEAIGSGPSSRPGSEQLTPVRAPGQHFPDPFITYRCNFRGLFLRLVQPPSDVASRGPQAPASSSAGHKAFFFCPYSPPGQCLKSP